MRLPNAFFQHRCTFIFLLGLGALLLVSCSTPKVSPATATARARQAILQATKMAKASNQAYAAEATATAQAYQSRRTAASQWLVVLSEPFDDNTHEWSLGKKTGEFADIEFQLLAGKFRWQATAHRDFLWWSSPTIDLVSDFYLSLEIQSYSSSTTSYAGVVMRLTSVEDSYQYYMFEIRQSGEYSFDLHTAEGWTTLIDWTPSPAIHPSLVNSLEVVAEGDTFSFFINGEWVADARDGTLGSGQTGLVVGLDEDGDSGTWEFDNFVVRAPFILPENPTP
jgi:hypothetical protein